MADNIQPYGNLTESIVSKGPDRPLFTKGGPAGYVENGLGAVAEHFKGITTAGTVLPGLFPIKKTGVSTQPMRDAAEAFIASLTRDQRSKTIFPIETVEWRKWSNIHPTLMRHGLPFFEMSGAQVDRAFALLKASLSAEGFQTAQDIMRLNETVMEMTGKLDEYGADLYWL
ncbi:MAG TPA: DUF3500 domain-containing protein, partial [Candidatus Binatia bacterium]|nr:DUF3500 domain-containing protein [Candidatus Binatia bacterium]